MRSHRVLAVTRRLLSQFRHDRRTLALLFVVPIVLMSLLYFMLRGSGEKPAVGIVTENPGPVASALASGLHSSSLIRATDLDRADAEKRLRDGSLAGYISLGQGAPQVRLEGSQTGPSGTVVQALQLAAVQAAGPGAQQLRPQVTYLYGGPAFDTLDYLGSALIGLIVFFLVFVITIVSFLRERSQGTLERLMSTPLRRSEIVLGYMAGFGLVALIQAAEVLVFALYVIGVRNQGPVWVIFGIELLMALAAVNLGIFLSMFARTEFQAVQFIPLVIVPQFILSGIIFPVSQEPGWLQAISNVLPLTYAVNGMRDVMVKGADLSWGSVQLDAAVVLGFCLLTLAASALTLRRRIA